MVEIEHGWVYLDCDNELLVILQGSEGGLWYTTLVRPFDKVGKKKLTEVWESKEGLEQHLDTYKIKPQFDILELLRKELLNVIAKK